jgi:hypothetical protein
MFAALCLAGPGGGSVGGSDDLDDQQKQAMDDAPCAVQDASRWK